MSKKIKKTHSPPRLKLKKTKKSRIIRVSYLALVVTIFILSVLVKNINLLTATAEGTSKTVRIYPLETKIFTTAQKAEFTRSIEGFTDPTETVLNQAVDAARPQAPAWQPTTTVATNVSNWTGLNYSFDTSSVRACSSNTSTVSVRQHGAYSITTPSGNSRNTQHNDAFQKLNISSLVIDDQKIAGNRVPGTTTNTSVNGITKTVKQTDLSHLKAASIVQLRESGTGRINTKIDNIWLDVTYVDTCNRGLATSRYQEQIFPTTPIAHLDVIYSSPINYMGQVENQTMDIYEPQGDAVSSRPLLVFVHGGAFINGSKSDMTREAQYYSQLGYTTATINYRLRPSLYTGGSTLPPFEQILPAVNDALKDTREAIRYLKHNRSTYKINSNKVAVLGFSAGGIVGLDTYLANTETDPDSKFKATSSQVHAVSSLSGELWGQAQATTNQPAVQMVNFETDPTATWYPDEELTPSETCQAIKSAGAVCEQHIIPGTGHNLYFIDQKDKVIPFLKNYLKL